MNSLIDDIIKNKKWPNADEVLAELTDVVVFGTGGASNSLTKVLAEHNVNILYYTDNDKSKHEKIFLGKTIKSPDVIFQEKPIILIASYWARDIAKQLKAHDITYYDFSFCVDFQRWKEHFNCEVFNSSSALTFAMNNFTAFDLESLLSCIRYRQTYDPLFLPEQYCEHYQHPQVSPAINDIYIDGGSWQGDTLQELKDALADNIEIHCFEPDVQNYKILNKLVALKTYLNVKINKSALWNKIQKLEFLCSDEAVHTMQSRVTDESSNGKKVQVDAIDLDSYCSQENITPTFLKLDVEGAELEVIEGAQLTLKGAAPKLALSAYHKPNDLWEIVEKVKAINPNYQFYFVHHSQHLLESVIYAKVKES
jgi:FkbM family methyltransferase